MVLCFALFGWLCYGSYRDAKQKKELPKRVEAVEQKVVEMDKRLTEKIDEVDKKIDRKLDALPPVQWKGQPVPIPHPSRELAEAPIAQQFDMVSACSGTSHGWGGSGW